MPRRNRFTSGGYVFHVLNRAVGRATLFESDADYRAFQGVLDEAHRRLPIRLLAYCLMPNHWHLILWPKGDDDLSAFMHWLTVTHTQRWHAFHQTGGTGPLYQGRFKSFPVEQDDYFYSTCRYVERNALRAALVGRAEQWRWCSLWQYAMNCWPVPLDAWPLPRPSEWIEYVNRVETEAELAAVRTSLKRGSPFASSVWRRQTAAVLGLEKTLKALGRPATRGRESFSAR
jgi:REP-associated tyrosine transposase